jgi:hypothetical protein
VTPKFIPGAIYESTKHGLVEFKGVDVYMGQATLHFYALNYDQSFYWLPEQVSSQFGCQNAPVNALPPLAP